jgi:hypothetical protein
MNCTVIPAAGETAILIPTSHFRILVHRDEADEHRYSSLYLPLLVWSTAVASDFYLI